MDWQAMWMFLWELISSLGVRLLSAAVVLLIGWRVARWLRRWIVRTPRLAKLDSGVRTFLASGVSVLTYVLLFLTVAMMLGIPTTSFITALASCGVAIGLALQGSLSNIAGGLMLLIFKPFKVGDYVETPDAAGTVTDITVVYTVLRTPDNKVITVPNGTLSNSVVQNYSAVEMRRVDLTFSVAYSSDIDEVKALLHGVVTAHPQVLCDPAPFARLAEHGDSALLFTVRAWCKTDDYWDVRFDLVEAVKAAFDEKGVAIPFPQMDIHLKNE
ncbi:MAG: mechanosensitive ion channel family protein [Ruminococcaceae bacterium]|nr:mechanosensitive ion channel family protein [Oscillospiraceae bacterium]